MAFDTSRSKSYRRRSAGPAFASFLERDAYREQRRKGRARTIAISVAIHLIAAALIVFFSIWDVDELWAPSVPVTMFGRLPEPGEDVRKALNSSQGKQAAATQTAASQGAPTQDSPNPAVPAQAAPTPTQAAPTASPAAPSASTP